MDEFDPAFSSWLARRESGRGKRGSANQIVASSFSALLAHLRRRTVDIWMGTILLLGGLLGEQSWRGPFFGVVALMAVAFVAVLVLLRGPRETRTPVPFSAPFTALRRPALAILAVAAAGLAFAVTTGHSALAVVGAAL